jgi:hypothetical protein
MEGRARSSLTQCLSSIYAKACNMCLDNLIGVRGSAELRATL